MLNISVLLMWNCAYLGARYSCLRVLLNKIFALVFNNIYLMSMYVFITFASWAFTTLILFGLCTVHTILES